MENISSTNNSQVNSSGASEVGQYNMSPIRTPMSMRNANQGYILRIYNLSKSIYLHTYTYNLENH